MLDYIDFADRSIVITPAPSSVAAAARIGTTLVRAGELFRFATQGVSTQHGAFGVRNDPVRSTCIRDNRQQAWLDFQESRDSGRSRPRRGSGSAIQMRAANRIYEIER